MLPSTQIGTLTENLVANELMVESERRLSVTQTPRSSPIPETNIIPAVAYNQHPTSQSIALANSGQAQSIKINVSKPSTIFF